MRPVDDKDVVSQRIGYVSTGNGRIFMDDGGMPTYAGMVQGAKISWKANN